MQASIADTSKMELISWRMVSLFLRVDNRRNVGRFDQCIQVENDSCQGCSGYKKGWPGVRPALCLPGNGLRYFALGGVFDAALW